jgi:hypothetical protein
MSFPNSSVRSFALAFICGVQLFIPVCLIAQSPINYADLDNWAAHPDKRDSADVVAGPSCINVQDTSSVDVFYVYPTIYGGKKFKKTSPNADLNNAALNLAIETKPILFQASAFNGVGRIFAPRYRQAHLSYYHTKNKTEAMMVFDTAYADVRAAFEHYLQYENKGRRFIIASHSQGTTHCIRLIKEMIDGKPIQEQLIVAYLVGMPVEKDAYQNIPACTSPEQTQCFCTWRSVKPKYRPKNWLIGSNIAVTNPLTWQTNETLAPKSLNLGGMTKIGIVEPEYVSAQIDAKTGLLFCSRPPIRGARLARNYHAGDINLFYMNIRQNARLRAGFATE